MKIYEVAEAASVSDIVTLLKGKKPAPVLLVVDPLFRLVRISEGDSYAENYGALGPLIDVPGKQVHTSIAHIIHLKWQELMPLILLLEARHLVVL